MFTNQSKVIEIGNKKVIDYEDIKPILNPTQSYDLEKVLRITPAKNRIETALGFTGLSKKDWFIDSGVIQDWDRDKSYITRWLSKDIRLPLGIAFRLSKVLGVSCEILFEDYA